jgi:hypothetical protein
VQPIYTEDIPCRCALDVSRGFNNVSLVLTAKQTKFLPTPTTMALGCKAQLDGRQPVRVSDSDCKILRFAAGQPYPCTDSTGSGSFCLSVEALLSSVPTAVDLMSGPSIVGFIVAASNSSSALQASATITFRRAPRLVSASFSSGYGQVELAFDQATSAPALSCDRLLGTSLLGARPVCTWTSPSTLAAILGTGATLLPGNRLFFAAAIADSSETFVTTQNQSVIVSAPAQPILPRVTIAGPDAVSACDTAVLTASATLAQGATFLWACTSDNAINNLLQNQTKGPIANIPGALLSPGRSYFISVRVGNRFGDLSDVVVRSLLLAPSPSMLLSIILPSPPYIRKRGLQLDASAILSLCSSFQGGSSPEYFWSISPVFANGTKGQQVLRGKGDVLVISAGVLSVAQYAVALTAIVPGQVRIFRILSLR